MLYQHWQRYPEAQLSPSRMDACATRNRCSRQSVGQAVAQVLRSECRVTGRRIIGKRNCETRRACQIYRRNHVRRRLRGDCRFPLRPKSFSALSAGSDNFAVVLNRNGIGRFSDYHRRQLRISPPIFALARKKRSAGRMDCQRSSGSQWFGRGVPEPNNAQPSRLRPN